MKTMELPGSETLRSWLQTVAHARLAVFYLAASYAILRVLRELHMQAAGNDRG